MLQLLRVRRFCLHWRQKRKPCSIVCLYIIIKSPVRWRQSLGAKLEIICLHNRVFLLTLKEMEHKFFFAAVARGSKQFFTIITRHNSIQSFSLFKTLFIFLVCLLSFFLIQCTNVRWLKAQKRTKLFLLQQISMVLHILFHHLSSKLYFFACNINIFFW